MRVNLHLEARFFIKHSVCALPVVQSEYLDKLMLRTPTLSNSQSVWMSKKLRGESWRDLRVASSRIKLKEGD